MTPQLYADQRTTLTAQSQFTIHYRPFTMALLDFIEKFLLATAPVLLIWAIWTSVSLIHRALMATVLMLASDSGTQHHLILQ